MTIGQHLQIPAFLVYSEGAYIPLQSCEIAQTPGRERLGRIWPSPYAGQRVIRSVLWCSAGAEDAVRPMGCYATSSAEILRSTIGPPREIRFKIPRN